jgi:hypothetical protein
MQPKFDQNKKFEILTLYPGYYGMVKATISRCCPFKNLLLRSFAIKDEWIPGELIVSGFQLLFVLLTEHKCA